MRVIFDNLSPSVRGSVREDLAAVRRCGRRCTGERLTVRLVALARGDLPPVPAAGKFFHNDDRFTRLIQFEKGRKPRPVPFEPGDPVVEEICEFADCIKTGRQPETAVADNLNSIRVMEAAYRSLAAGKPVNIEDVQ